MSEQEMIARLLCDDPEARRIAGELEAPCFDDSRPDVQDYWRALAEIVTTLASRTPEPIEAPENGETDPEWRAIRRAIDQFVGRVPVVSKHRAVHNTHLAETVAHLDAIGEPEAADTIVWQCWYRALDRERERFLLADAREQIAASRTPEGMVMVPREPTEAMLVKGYTAYHAGATNAPDLWRNIWAAMISATPTPSGAE